MRNLGGEGNKLNKDEPEINRGIELLLRKKRGGTSNPKTFHVRFGKMFSLLKREIHFQFDFFFDYKKK